MVTREQIVDYVFNNVKDVLLDGIESHDDRSLVEEGYRDRVDNFIDDSLLTASSLEDGKIKWFLLNTRKYDLSIFSLPPQQRINMFKVGPYIDALNLYRNLAHQLAIHYLNHKAVPENYDQQRIDILKYMEELKDAFSEREELNEFYNQVTEQTLLDLEFANGDTSSISKKIGEILEHRRLLEERFNNK